MGRPEMARKQQNPATQGGGPARSGRVRLRLAVKFHEDGRLVVALLPGRHV